MASARRDDSDKRAIGWETEEKRARDGHEKGETRKKEREREREKERRREYATKREELGRVGRASDGRRDGRLDSITWRTILPRRHCLLEHLLGFSWFGTSSTVSRVPLHHDILFVRYNTDDDDDDDVDNEEDDEEDGEEDDENRKWRGLPLERFSSSVSRRESSRACVSYR
jgi:hypothetical protein